jgi:23S rRNA pseudouridine1911/1915/1917 synthase
VGHGIQQRRIDKYLHGRLPNLSRAMIQKQISAGEVKVNGRAVKASHKLSYGDTIDLAVPRPAAGRVVPEDIPLDIIHEDDDIIVLNKQAGILVHPARGNTHGTLVNALAFHCEKLSAAGFDIEDPRPGIVHRLDRNTTGVMVAAKNPRSQWKIAGQFQHRQVGKTYLAIVHGTPQLTSDRINAPLGVHPKVREKYAILGRSETAKDAVTYYEVLEPFRGYCLLKLSPRTGRTHQIRVHLSHIKHPVVGDDMYGGKCVCRWQLAGAEPALEEPVINRCALHAWTLEFIHPTTKEQVKFEAPLPDDMTRLLEALRELRGM